MADGKVTIDVILDDGTVKKGVANVDKQLSDLEGSGQKAALGIGKIVTALGLVAAGAGAIRLIRNSLDSAFRRIDTFEQFERVMTAVTGSTQEANRALEITDDIVTGTGYTLDGAAQAVQNFVTRGATVDEATKYIEAWGDAVAFYGDGSQAQFENVTDALAKMQTKGTVEMDQLNRLFDAGIDAVGMYAKATGRSASDVQNDLSAGRISAEDFIDTVSTAMMEGTNGVINVSGAAKEMGATWGSTFANMRTAVARGVANVIESIDEMLENNGLPNMREMVSEFGDRFESVLTGIANKIPSVVQTIMNIYNALKPWLPLISGIVAAFLTFNTVIAVVEKVRMAFMAARTAVMVFNATLMANPVALIIAAIVGLAIIIYAYWDEIKEYTIIAWNAIKDFFISFWDSIKNIFNAAVEYAVKYIQTRWNQLKALTSAAWNGIKSFFSSVWNGIKRLFTTVITAIVNFVKQRFNAAKNNISSIFNAIRNTTSNVWNGIKNAISNVVNGIRNTISNIFNSLRGIVTGAFNNVRSAVSNGINGALRVVTNIGKSFYNAGRNLVTSIANGIRNAVSSVTSAISSVTSKIRNFLPFSPAKEGALKDLDKLDFGGTIAQSIRRGRKQALKEMDGLTSDLEKELQPEVVPNRLRGHSIQRAIGSIIPLSVGGPYPNNHIGRSTATTKDSENKQPLYVNLRLGTTDFKGFVNDITEVQDRNKRVIDMFRG